MGDPLGTYASYLSPRYRGDAVSYLATLRRLRELPAPDLVLPGHPRSTPQPQSPVMTQARWEALLDPGIVEMSQLVERYRQDGAHFLDGTPGKLLNDLYYLGDFRKVAVYGFSTAGTFTLVNAPGGPGPGQGLSSFVLSRLARLGVSRPTKVRVLLTGGDPEESAGLPDLIKTFHPQVVATPAAWDKVKSSCPGTTSFLPAEDLPRQLLLSVTVFPVGGRGVGSVAYQISIADKKVLFTGRVPIRMSEQTMKAVVADFKEGRGDRRAYMTALHQLAEAKPDLWLPAFPEGGANVRLYGADWENNLRNNARIFRQGP